MTKEDIKSANALIAAFYGDKFNSGTPNEKTTKVLATMVRETGNCNKSISKLLNSLSSTTGASGALKIVRAAAKLAKSDKKSFEMCNAVVKSKYRSVLEITMI
ncbi:hypothetical protein DXX93_11220 [Thalassotalea euphylliae]|uniref:Uncharacterized protein n=1 Tax=Thalassotalea euphylliae TaxID=1655234 RepID=A0A3E0TR88_9GAMM|nr:hypothetical protein [Thalassotalea euphylliae]REL27079.1 hypothetical protein DXX93_11220 [Thalassotalea euphylliae]